jgi:hypothetical protein
MIRRTLTGLIGATLITVGLAGPVAADVLPDTDEMAGSASFAQTVGAVVRDWHVEARSEAFSGVTVMGASFSAGLDTTCHGGDQDGQPGFRSILFTGESPAALRIPGSLAVAVAGARVEGTETTFDSCTGLETTRTTACTIGLALRAIAEPVTASGQKCIDPEQVLDSTFTFRTAAGGVVLDGWPIAAASALISQTVSIYTADPACAEA